MQWRDQVSADQDSHVQFRGSGATPEERCACMQQQLAALCSSATFLAPSSWSACQCVTSVKIWELKGDAAAAYLSAATHTGSLTSLHASLDYGSSLAALSNLSSLRHLTSLQLGIEDYTGTPADWVAGAIAQLSNLQRLTVNMHTFSDSNDAAGASVPVSWTALTSLTTVALHGPFMASQPLSRLVAVQHLSLHGLVCGGGSLASLFALTALDQLEVRNVHDNVVDEEDGSDQRLEVPRQYTGRLQCLRWMEYSESSTVVMLPLLTRLTSLTLICPRVTPQLCRCAGYPYSFVAGVTYLHHGRFLFLLLRDKLSVVCGR